MTPRPIGVKTIVLAATALLALSLSACGNDDSSAHAQDKPAALSLDDLSGKVYATGTVDGHPLVDETIVRIGFTDDQVSVDAGCNHMTGTGALEGNRLTVSSLRSTEIGCEQDRADQDAWISGFLTGGPTLSVDGNTLTLTEGDVTMALAAQPVDDAPTGDPGDTVTSNG